jgi:hypothetical protein
MQVSESMWVEGVKGSKHFSWCTPSPAVALKLSPAKQ